MNRFEAWLRGAEFDVQVKEFPAGTRTAVDAASAVGCELGQIVKSLVFVAAGKPVVALVSGINRLDERKLGAVAGAVEDGLHRRPDGPRADAKLHGFPDAGAEGQRQ